MHSVLRLLDRTRGNKVLDGVLEKVEQNVASTEVSTANPYYASTDDNSKSFIPITEGDGSNQVITEDIFYYYYTDDDKASSSNVNGQEIEDQINADGDSQIGDGTFLLPDERSCSNSLVINGEMFTRDVTFAFAAEMNGTTRNDLAIANLAKTRIFRDHTSYSLLDNVSSALLHCESSKGSVFLVRYPASDSLVKVSPCSSTHSTSSSCTIFKGTLLLSSGQSITDEEQHLALARIKDYIEGIPQDKIVKSVEYLGPHIPREQISHGVYVNHPYMGIFSLVVLLVGLLITLSCCWSRPKRRRTFDRSQA